VKLIYAVLAGHFLQCYDCPGSKSFEDCQSQQTLVNCSEASDVCFQTSVEYHNESYKREEFDMGCLGKSFCDSYRKGDIGYCNTLRDLGFTVQCVSECCYEDECNKENLLESKGSALVTSVVILLLGLVLALVNIH